MKATEVNFLKFLKQPNQFVIPIYQRTYSWTLKQCQQLWLDLIKASDEEVSGHFVGSIVYIEGSLYQVASIPQLLVIDGQQRLTTLSLFLSALGKVSEELEVSLETTRKKIESYFLFNNEEDGDDRYKLLLTQGDRETFIRIIEGRELPTEPSKQILENYQYFENQLRRSDTDLKRIYHGISKLIIVNIALDRDRDNPQLIFESLNSTGLDLSQADLIRNYVLMGLPVVEQEKIYNHYWYPMEQLFGEGSQSDLFDRFMRDYLTLKSRSGAIPNIRDVYTSFKTYVQKQVTVSINDIMAEVYRYAKHYSKLVLERESDVEICRILQDINMLRVDVAYPFLMEVYEDWDQGILTRQDFIRILRLIESYVFRRSIAGVPTNSMNKTFSTLSREIDRERYIESMESSFARKDSYRRFPDNDEFRRELLVKDIYNFRNRGYLLRKLENYKRNKELVDLGNYTVEHIVPQNPKLSPEWQHDLGENWKEIQTKYLHTIGNLTLTAYNSEYSDRSFAKKRDMDNGFKVSPLYLNHSLAQLDQWNEGEIQKRAKILADWATQIWTIPKIETKDYQVSEYDQPSLGESYRSRHSEYLQGDILILFEALRKRILNLDDSVREEYKKLYIAYKTSTNFVDIVPQKSKLRLSLNMRFEDIDDPKGLCKDITNLGRWGNGDVEIGLSKLEQIDSIMLLIRQAFNKHSEEIL